MDKNKEKAAMLVDQNNPWGMEFVCLCKWPLLFRDLVSENHYFNPFPPMSVKWHL